MTGEHADKFRLSATTLLVRDRPGGFETLMIQRPQAASFGGAWVWPGGAVDAADAPVGSFADEAEELSARAAGRRELHEETGLDTDADRLVPLAIWTPPAQTKPKFRSWFFVADEHSGELNPQPEEVAAVEWVTPREMLEAHTAGELELVVPTWVTLHQLAEHRSAAEVVEHAAAGPVDHYATRFRKAEQFFCWFGDAAFEDELGNGQGRHRLETAALPWRYLRDAG
ncbi:NUDIX domain-containing protein [Gulosibacter macacae]|uniref:NUDIX domain-containing protein n=1 Tax=Gulosibacter macacae TaxID=2488791 RepID=UPI0016399D49|nr:NUDIX hydrolase [Gulosibacter macacae]